MRRLAVWLVRRYPRRWRDRYGAEMLELVTSRAVHARDIADLLRGVLDAHARPDLVPSLQPATATGPAERPAPGEWPAPATGPYGIVRGHGPGALSRRSFLRRMLGTGVGLLSLEFLGGTVAFLWPNITEGLGARFRVGTLPQILAAEPRFATGQPFSFTPARVFLVNVPAARALASGEERSLPRPAADEMIALWRKCPHLGCMVPELCDSVKRFQCRCHGSTYNILGEKLEKGPAERGMDRFAVEIEDDGTVVIDTREILFGPPEGILTFTDPHPADAGCG